MTVEEALSLTPGSLVRIGLWDRPGWVTDGDAETFDHFHGRIGTVVEYNPFSDSALILFDDSLLSRWAAECLSIVEDGTLHPGG